MIKKKSKIRFSSIPLSFLTLILFGTMLVSSISATPVVNAEESESDNNSTEENGENYSIPKPDYLPGIQSGIDPGEEAQDFFLNSTIPRIINIATGLLGIAAFLGIIFSAFTMLTAYGNEDKINKGKTTLTYSLIGFAIIIFAYAIVSVIVSIALPQEDIDEEAGLIPKAFAAGENYEENVDILFPDQTSLIEDRDNQNRVSLPSGDLTTEIVPAIVVNIMYMIGFMIFISFIYAGILMVTGRGNEEMNKKAKNIIIWSGIALILVSTAYAIIYGIASLNLYNDPSTENDDVFVETVVE